MGVIVQFEKNFPLKSILGKKILQKLHRPTF